MGGFDGLLQSLDEGVTGLFGSWNGYSTALATALVALVTYSVVTHREPDVHPLLLVRQAEHNRIRMPRESPVYGSRYTDQLTTGLGVKDAGASKWARGRDGDLRDVWRGFTKGTTDERYTAEQGGQAAAGGARRGRLLTALGSEQVVEHRLDDITRQIVVIGKHIAGQGGSKVAVYLPNSIEFLATLFACTFDTSLTPILLPFDIPTDALVSMLRRSAADTVVTAPGAFPFDAVVKAYPAVKNLIWVVDEGSSHLDWNEVPEGIGGSVNVATWQDVLLEAPVTEAAVELPAGAGEEGPRDVVTFWQGKEGEMEEMVRFSQANLVSGIAGQVEAIPGLCPNDLFLPADSLATAHTLIVTLAAMCSHASVALTSVAGNDPEFSLTTQGVSPTVLLATPGTLLKLHADKTAGLASSTTARYSHWRRTQSLVRDGRLPSRAQGSGQLRLVVVAERAGAGTAPLKPAVLSDLRALMGVRLVYALTAAKVAGAVAQTMAFDYRVDERFGDKCSHFGGPLRCLRYVLRDTAEVKNSDEKYQGEIFALGPCVVGGEASTGVVGTIRPDNTLAYA